MLDFEASAGARALFDKQHEATVKYDYFVSGVSGAIFAYIAEHYTPQKLAFDFFLLEPLALLALALSMYFGLKRLETHRNFTALNHLLTDCEEKAIQVGKVLENPTEGLKDLSGRKLSPEEIENERQQHAARARGYAKQVPALVKLARRYYKLRDRFLILGFAAILLSKVLQPYGSGASQKDQTARTLKPQQPLTTIPTNQIDKPIQAQIIQTGAPSAMTQPIVPTSKQDSTNPPTTAPGKR
jgi:hypothetical protein